MISPNATNQNSNDNIGSAFATLLRKSLSERSSDGSSLPKPNESSLQNPELKFTVFSFRGSSQKPPALIMESVEMGRNPMHMDGNNLIFKGAQNLAMIQNRKFNLTSFGTGGGVDLKTKIGEVVQLQGSLFVGFETINSSDNLKYIPVLKVFNSQNENQPLLAHPPEGFDSREKAQVAARELFLNLSEKNPPFNENRKIPQLLSQLRSAQNYSLTVTEIGSDEVKKKGQEFHFKNVNMEDYQVLNSWSQLKPESKGELRLLRIVSDTHDVSDSIALAAFDWAKNHSITVKESAELILWGLNGSPISPAETIPVCALWKAFNHLAMTEVVPFLSPIESQDNGLFLDPFAKEFAESFFSDLESERLITEATLDTEIVSSQVRSNQNVKELISYHLKNMIQLAKNIKNTQTSDQKETLARKLAEHLAYLVSPSGQKIPLFARSPFSNESMDTVKLHIWARPGKWNGNESTKLTDVVKHFKSLNEFKLSPSFDRMFYRSNMSAAMPKGISTVLNQFQTCQGSRFP
jgi:hypothetical protein